MMKTIRERSLILMALLLLFASGTYFIAQVSTREALLSLLLIAGFALAYASAEKAGWVEEFYAPGSLSDDESGSPAKRDWRGTAFFALVCVFHVSFVLLTGGLRSPFFSIIYLPLILAGLRYGVVLGILLSTLAAAVYLAVVSPLDPRHAFGVPVFLTFPLAGLFGSMLHARLRGSFRQVSEKIAELDALIDVSQMLETAIDLDTSLNLVLINAQRVNVSVACAIYLLDPDRMTLRLAASTGMHDGDFLAHTSSVSEMTMNGWQLGDEDIFVRSRKFSVGSGTVDSSWLDDRSSHALYASLSGPEGLIGLIYMTRASYETPFTNTERAVMKRFAAHVGMPLHKARFQDNLEKLAYHDQMTGLSNFRYFDSRLNDEVSRAKRYHQNLSVLMLDIDYFKKFNDQFGHRAGDHLLHRFGQIVRDTLRESDLPARYGGEEFAVICPGASLGEAAMVAERIRRAVAEAPFVFESSLNEQSAPAHVTVSIGIASYPVCCDSPESLMLEADRALYAAKKQGRNKVVMSDRLFAGEGLEVTLSPGTPVA
jgi:diguanylate cyclase (GGDEF)-like protein